MLSTKHTCCAIVIIIVVPCTIDTYGVRNQIQYNQSNIASVILFIKCTCNYALALVVHRTDTLAHKFSGHKAQLLTHVS